jgi:hypothetical protein
MKLKTVKSSTVVNNFVDASTGEILDVEIDVKHERILADTREEFFFTYASIIGVIQELDKVSVNILMYCNTNAQWNTNMVALTKPVVEDICKTFDIKYQTVRNAVSKLKKTGIFIHLGNSTYRINPRYYWKGNTNERNNTMKYVLEVECKTC